MADVFVAGDGPEKCAVARALLVAADKVGLDPAFAVRSVFRGFEVPQEVAEAAYPSVDGVVTIRPHRGRPPTRKAV